MVVALAEKALSVSCRPVDATEDELLVGAPVVPLVGSLGFGAEFDVERR